LKFFFFIRLVHPFFYPPHHMTSLFQYMMAMPPMGFELTSQISVLTPSYAPLSKPQAPQAPQACMHTHVSKMLTYSSSIFDTSDWGSKIEILSWNFYGRWKDIICTYGKNFIYFRFKKNFMCHFKSSTSFVYGWFSSLILTLMMISIGFKLH
jgi:hypothetical protein